MNDLILGRPQRINDGDVMLGLLSWHLYPDMTVLGVGTRTYHVPQQDRLIAPGGMITVGMGSREGCPDETIYWSLPLAHMRFYGDPVNAEHEGFSSILCRLPLCYTWECTVLVEYGE